jgi:hypothetical protein
VHLYDNLSKALFEKDGPTIIPELVEGAQVMSVENVELDRSKLKADMVYRGPFGFVKRQEAVYDLEVQSGPDPDLLQGFGVYCKYICCI